MPALNCLFLYKENSSIHTHNPTHAGPAQAYMSHLSRASQTATQRVGTQIETSGSESTSHHVTWSLPISLGSKRALAPKREDDAVVLRRQSAWVNPGSAAYKPPYLRQAT